MPSIDDTLARVVAWASELAPDMRAWTNGELLENSRVGLRRRRAGDASDELLAGTLGACREALERATGVQTDAVAMMAAAAVARGFVATVRRDDQARAALTHAAYWHGLSGVGVHIMTPDERSAGGYQEFLAPALSLLGGDVGLVRSSATPSDLRAAYAAMVTVGTCSQYAADYLRDNLHDSVDGLVQRGLAVAIIVNADDLLDRALTQFAVTAPGNSGTESDPETVRLVHRFRRGADYQTSRPHRAIAFGAPAMEQIKRAIGWSDVASAAAVARAAAVEKALLRRENLVEGNARDAVADITLQGYLRCYVDVAGVSSGGGGDSSRLESTYGLRVWDGAAPKKGSAFRRRYQTPPSQERLSFEHLIDEQRSAVYALRKRVRDAEDPFAAIDRLAAEAVGTWLAGGTDAVAAGLADVLAGHGAESAAEVPEWAETPGELGERATLAIRHAVELRWATAVDVPELIGLVRRVQLTVIDLQWSRHLACLRFIQRQASALYGSNLALKKRDAECLFAACWRGIHDESIKYLLNLQTY